MPDPAATVAMGQLVELPAAVRCVEFISDLHLCPEMPRTLAGFAAYLADSSADALFILGDLFEVWVGDDAAHQPFEREACALLAAWARQRPLFLMQGNRDFLLGPAALAACGAQFLPDPTPLQAFGQRYLLSHGDALCLDDAPYQAFRRMVRGAAWQADFLAKPLAERLELARQMRQASRAQQHPEAVYADADSALAQAWLAQAGAQTLIHGHTHRPTSEQREGGWRREVLSDWDLDHAQRAEALRLSALGFERLSLGA